MERNKEREKREGPPAPNSAIQLPFIIVNTSKKTVIDCSISNDKMEYLFNFDDTFEIHDDMEVIKQSLAKIRKKCNLGKPIVFASSQWVRKLKKSEAKKLVKSHKSISRKNNSPNSIFCSFKNDQKSIFELGKSLKLPKISHYGCCITVFENFLKKKC